MGKALYRKYRSKSLSEIIGQEHITKTLDNALKSGKVAHAYLLTGPRGVGKTSIARILAHEINGLPYSEDQTHLDIIEIDAASNNGVEDVRELREKIPSAPVSAPYKVFIIDEVHMLSRAAFNALLKTLEEPPEHVIFILATTEAYKLPETIVSRTQRFTFRPVTQEKVIAHLSDIAKKEKITISNEALELIAAHGEGSFRDSISLLDQVSNVTDSVERDDVERLLGLAPSTLIGELIASLQVQGTAACVATLTKLYDEGYEPAMIAVQLGQTLRTQYLDGKAPQHTLALLKELLDVPASRNPKALLEIVLLGHASPEEAAATPQPQKPVAQPMAPKQKEVVTAAPVPAPQPAKKAAPQQAAEKATPESVETAREQESTEAAIPNGELLDATELWQEVLKLVKQTHNTLYGIARMATPRINDDTLVLEMKFAFHQKRLNEPKNKAVIADVVEKIRQAPTQVVYVVADKNSESKQGSENIAAISNIFGSAELLES